MLMNMKVERKKYLEVVVNKKEKKLIKEVISMCDKYNFWDKISMRWALTDVKNFLMENFHKGK